jgi:hypothetical protein
MTNRDNVPEDDEPTGGGGASGVPPVPRDIPFTSKQETPPRHLEPRRWARLAATVAAGLLLGLAILAVGLGRAPGATGDPEPPAGPVDYQVSGQGKAVVTYGADGGMNPETEAQLPWSQHEPNDPGVFSTYSLTAHRTSGAGALTCRITVDGEVVAEQSASGSAAIASCTGS